MQSGGGCKAAAPLTVLVLVLTLGKTVLVMKDPQQGSIYSNYRLIICLRTTRKLLSGILADKIGVHMVE